MEGAEELKMQLAREMASLQGEEAHRLCGILRGVLTHLQAVDERLKVLESAAGIPATLRAGPDAPCAIRRWLLVPISRRPSGESPAAFIARALSVCIFRRIPPRIADTD